MALIDVGLKSEGRVPIREFAAPGQPADIKVGDVVEVFVERMEDPNGEAVLSRDKARREEAWEKLEKAFTDTERLIGDAAKNQTAKNPINTIFDAKRLIGAFQKHDFVRFTFLLRPLHLELEAGMCWHRSGSVRGVGWG